MSTKTFSELGIKSRTLGGDKITIGEILDQQVKVLDYRIKESHFGKKHEESKCLYLQIEFKGEKRVVFTGSTVLMEMISEVPQNDFPFTATIIKERDWYKFT